MIKFGDWLEGKEINECFRIVLIFIFFVVYIASIPILFYTNSNEGYPIHLILLAALIFSSIFTAILMITVYIRLLTKGMYDSQKFKDTASDILFNMRKQILAAYNVNIDVYEEMDADQYIDLLLRRTKPYTITGSTFDLKFTSLFDDESFKWPSNVAFIVLFTLLTVACAAATINLFDAQRDVEFMVAIVFMTVTIMLVGFIIYYFEEWIRYVALRAKSKKVSNHLREEYNVMIKKYKKDFGFNAKLYDVYHYIRGLEEREKET